MSVFDAMRQAQIAALGRKYGLMEWQMEMILAEPKGFMRDVVQDQRRNVLHQDKLMAPVDEAKKEYSGPRIGGGPASPEAHALYLERRRIRGEI
jgi:hypothetical protein